MVISRGVIPHNIRLSHHFRRKIGNMLNRRGLLVLTSVPFISILIVNVIEVVGLLCASKSVVPSLCACSPLVAISRARVSRSALSLLVSNPEAIEASLLVFVLRTIELTMSMFATLIAVEIRSCVVSSLFSSLSVVAASSLPVGR